MTSSACPLHTGRTLAGYEMKLDHIAISAADLEVIRIADPEGNRVIVGQ